MSEIGENLMRQGQASKAGEELFASRECPKQGVKFAESDEEVHCHQIKLFFEVSCIIVIRKSN